MVTVPADRSASWIPALRGRRWRWFRLGCTLKGVPIHLTRFSQKQWSNHKPTVRVVSFRIASPPFGKRTIPQKEENSHWKEWNICRRMTAPERYRLLTFLSSLSYIHHMTRIRFGFRYQLQPNSVSAGKHRSRGKYRYHHYIRCFRR